MNTIAPIRCKCIWLIEMVSTNCYCCYTVPPSQMPMSDAYWALTGSEPGMYVSSKILCAISLHIANDLGCGGSGCQSCRSAVVLPHGTATLDWYHNYAQHCWPTVSSHLALLLTCVQLLFPNCCASFSFYKLLYPCTLSLPTPSG